MDLDLMRYLTLAELSSDEKNMISARKKALELAKDRIKNEFEV